MMMAQRRCVHSLTRQLAAAAAVFSLTPKHSLHHYQTLESLPFHSSSSSSKLSDPISSLGRLTSSPEILEWAHQCTRHFSSSRTDDDEDNENEDVEEESDDDVDVDVDDTASYSPEEKEAEAAAIGYKVVGSLQKEEMDAVFKPYEPVFAVVQIGSHQFKVSNGDCIYTERLKFCDVNDKLILNKVLLMGSANQTVIGRPTVPNAAVHAVVEEHALDAKVIIFKKKRRKNYRRTKGHRQELTKLRITDMEGISKPEQKFERKPLKAATKKPEKIADAA